MLDTVRLRSPSLGEPEAVRIGRELTRRLAIKVATGEVLYEFTAGELEGSYDHRVSVQVKREEWQAVSGVFGEATVGRGKPPTTRLVPCDPYVVIEGSIHKALLGHNVYGGPSAFDPAVRWFLDRVGSLLGVELLPAVEWEVQRVDWAEAFELPYEAIEEYISSLNAATYPRRRVHRYGRQAIFSPGHTTAVKAYHKGPEFACHDRRRLGRLWAEERVIHLQQQANAVLRIETSIKSRKLAADLGDKPRVVQVTDAYLQSVHDLEVARLLKEGRSEMETVRTRVEVSRRLYETYSRPMAGALFATWVQLAGVGEEETRRGMSRRSFYRHRKLLLEAGCSWSGADVYFGKTAIPAGFAPVRADPRRLSGEAPEVRRQLVSYRAAA